MTVWNVVVLLVWILILPFCIGTIPVRWMKEEKRSMGVILLAGYLIVWPLCWLVTVPCTLLITYDSFLFMVPIYTVLLAVFAAAGIWGMIRDRKAGRSWWRRPEACRRGREEILYWCLFAVLVAWQLFHAFTMTSFDGDDAEYVAQSLVTVQSDSMYRVMPYTGGSTALDVRHSLAVLPIWIAYLGRISGIHTTILAHSMLPHLLIPLTYVVFYEIGKQLFKEKKEQLPVFMSVMALLQLFGNVSIYTNETFFLTRTWQGKAVAASLILPLTICLLLWIFDEKKGTEDLIPKKVSGKISKNAPGKIKRKPGEGEEKENKTENKKNKPVNRRMKKKRIQRRRAGITAALMNLLMPAGFDREELLYWGLLVLTNMAAGICTSMVVFLNVLLIGAVGFWMSIAEKRIGILVKTGIVCIPNGIYMLLYLFLHPWI